MVLRSLLLLLLLRESSLGRRSLGGGCQMWLRLLWLALRLSLWLNGSLRLLLLVLLLLLMLRLLLLYLLLLWLLLLVLHLLMLLQLIRSDLR